MLSNQINSETILNQSKGKANELKNNINLKSKSSFKNNKT